MLIEILKWDKYNPRANAKHWSWLRLENNFFDDEDLDDFSGHQFVVWIYALTRRNKANTVAFEIKLKHCAKKSGCTEAEVVATLKLLATCGKIRIHEPAPTAPAPVVVSEAPARTYAYVDVPARTQENVHVPARTHECLTDDTLRHDTDGRTDVSEGHPGDAASAPGNEPPAVVDPPPAPTAVVTERRARKAKPPPAPSTAGSAVWEAYRAAYADRYGHDPVRNATVNSQCLQLVGRLGADAAVKVVEFYLTHANSWYVRGVHALGLCLKDCEGLHTQMLANHRVSSAEAATIDKSQSNAQAFAAVAAKLKAEGKL